MIGNVESRAYECTQVACMLARRNVHSEDLDARRGVRRLPSLLCTCGRGHGRVCGRACAFARAPCARA
eukprot:3043911-Pleurochrysis_carterae.AAC.1